MPKFELSEIGGKTTGGSGTINYLLFNGASACMLEEWAFASCAVNCFYNMNTGSTLWANKENIDALIAFLTVTAGYPGGWKPGEFYFCVTPHQRDLLPVLTNHPCVKLIDKFKNKSHGDNIMHLYRLSFTKDFS